jgi:AcrR family transcriptional regulator
MYVQIRRMTRDSLREKNKLARREKILANAMSLIAANGERGFTLKQLAEESDVTIPTIYNLLGGREEVILTSIELALREVDDVLMSNDALTGVDRGIALLDSLFALLASNKRTYKAVFRTLYELESTAVSQAMGDLFTNAGHRFELIVHQAYDEGDLRGDLKHLPLAHNVVHATLGAIRMWSVGSLKHDVALARAGYAFLTTLLSDATPKGRKKMMALVKAPQTLLDK